MSALEKFTTLLPRSDDSSEGFVSTPRGSLEWRGEGEVVEAGEVVEMDDLCRGGGGNDSERDVVEV